MIGLRQRWRDWRTARALARRAIPDALWNATLAQFPFLAQRPDEALARLRTMTSLFLDHKEFSGAQGLVVTDAMAVAVAAQACLPVLSLGLTAYDQMVGIVLHPRLAVARRSTHDDDGIVHDYDEVLAGEAVQRGPVMLAWSDVAAAGHSAADAYNVVIHEFMHVLDMSNGDADGIPPMTDAAMLRRWSTVLSHEYTRFCHEVNEGWRTALDPYGAESPGEFFPVAAEAFFVAPQDMRDEHPALYALFADYFQQDPLADAQNKSGR